VEKNIRHVFPQPYKELKYQEINLAKRKYN